MEDRRKGGRPRKVLPTNYEHILDAYIYGLIGRRECNKLLGLSDTTKLSDCSFYREYLADNGIAYHRNNVDMWNSNKFKNSTNPKKIAAVVSYINGSDEIVYMSDTYLLKNFSKTKRGI